MKKLEIPGYKQYGDVGDLAFEDILAFREGKKRPLKTSSKKLNDKIGGFNFGNQAALVMPSGAGKTALGMTLMEDFVNPEINPVYENKIIGLVDSFEMPAKSVFLRSMSKRCNLTTQEILSYRERLSDERLDFLKAIKEKLTHVPIYVRQSPQTVKEWREHKKHIFGLFPSMYFVGLFDHTQLATISGEKDEIQLMGSLATEGMYLTNTFDYFQIFLSQVNGNIETSVDREKLGQHLLQKTDIFGSSKLYNTCDFVLTGQRPGMYGLKEWRKIPTGLTKDLAGDDTLLILNVLKGRESGIGVLALRHNVKHFQFFDELPNDSGKVQEIDLSEMSWDELNDE